MLKFYSLTKTLELGFISSVLFNFRPYFIRSIQSQISLYKQVVFRIMLIRTLVLVVRYLWVDTWVNLVLKANLKVRFLTAL